MALVNTAYKVVWSQDDRWWSSDVSGRWQLEYKLNEKTHPSTGEVFVFPDLRNAVRYASDTHEVLLVECGELTRQYWFCGLPATQWSKWWRANREEKVAFFLHHAWEGCHTTPWVIPRRRVWPGE